MTTAIVRRLPLVLAAIIAAAFGHSVLRAQNATPAQEPVGAQPPTVQETVVVVGATPIVGIGIDPNLIPSGIQTIQTDALGRTGGSGLTEQMALGMGSVHINDATANAFQPDLQFRGFVASPLLGLPQGLSVYQNGVRLNEPFGDTVNWDLIPDNAIAGLTLMPGSNPLFGLNTLGGAVSVQTKTGFSHRGGTIAASFGSFGRRLIEAELGGHTDTIGYFVAGNAMAEDGWRDFSPSRVRQVFGDVEWRRSARTKLNLTINASANRLIGNGPAPIELLDEDRTDIFTHPDRTTSRAVLVSLRARHERSDTVAFDATFYYRRASIGTLNGDDSDYQECEVEDLEDVLCSDGGDGEPVEDQFGELIPVDEDDELNAANNTSKTTTNGFGGALQTTITTPLGSRPNHFVAGLTFDGGRSGYEADTEIARLTADRGTDGIGLFDEEAVVRLRTTVRHTGLFVADFLTLAPRLTVMGAARFNHSAVTLRDQAGDDLNGDHSFSRLNPAAGLTYQVNNDVTAYGSVSMSSRVPAPSELSCADPDDPCRLPNAFLSDPPLEEVVATTLEAGLRGYGQGVAWSASIFRTSNRDDIMFISSGPLTNTGHFQNVGDTRRQGIELSATGAASRVRWALAYSFLNATFETPLTLSSPNHPDEDGGEIHVEAGSRVPGMPQHNLKANLSIAVRRLNLGGSLSATSSQHLRSDEANLLPAIDGYAIVNLSADYAIADRVRMTGRITNLFGAEYSTFGLLGEPDEVLGDDFEDPRFITPGAPRAAWVGIEISFR